MKTLEQTVRELKPIWQEWDNKDLSGGMAIPFKFAGDIYAASFECGHTGIYDARGKLVLMDTHPSNW